MAVSSEFKELQQIKFDLFKTQNLERGRFDITFEIEGKLIHAHKTMLILVSDTFDSMLSDRWATKDEAIKIEAYSYNEFYEFINFLYCAQCELNDTNIFKMVDIAEFYGVEAFKKYCHRYSSHIKITIDNVFHMMDFAYKFSINQLKESIKKFMENNSASVIKSNGFLNVSKAIAKDLVVTYKYTTEPEDMFQAVFKWCEKQAMTKQPVDQNAVLNDAIRAEFFDFYLLILFRQMERNFFNEFVVPRAYVLPSLTELTKILCDRDRFFEGNIKVTNTRGQTLHGKVISDKTVLRNIEALKLSTAFNSLGEKYCYWITRCKLPSTSSTFKRRDGVEWYLNYDRDGDINVTHSSIIEEDDHLLAELNPGASGFDKAVGCQIEIE